MSPRFPAFIFKDGFFKKVQLKLFLIKGYRTVPGVEQAVQFPQLKRCTVYRDKKALEI